MKVSILLIGLCIILMTVRAQEGPTALLENLILESEQSLEDLRAQWATNQQLFQIALASVQSQRDAQNDQCQVYNANLATTTAELEANQAYIQWILNRVAQNVVRVQELEENRCNSSLLYISGLKNNKIALKLLAFLKSAIQAKDSLSLVQRQQIYARLGLFLQMYSDHKIKEMIQTLAVQYDVDFDTPTQRRDAGSGHIDNDREQINIGSFQSGTRKSWGEYKTDLLALLDQLEATISAQTTNAQNDEMNAGVALADYKLQIDQENVALDKQLAIEQATQGSLIAKQTEQQNVVETCNSQLALADQQVATANAQYQDEVDRFQARKDSLAAEISAFRSVYGMYTLHVAPTGGAARKVDEFDFISMF